VVKFWVFMRMNVVIGDGEKILVREPEHAEIVVINYILVRVVLHIIYRIYLVLYLVPTI
jgi:hypothetical protein